MDHADSRPKMSAARRSIGGGGGGGGVTNLTAVAVAARRDRLRSALS